MNTCGPARCGRTSYSPQTSCSRDNRSLEGLPLAMAYVPMQYFKSVYNLDEALQQGTIFPELNKPFMGWNGGCHR